MATNIPAFNPNLYDWSDPTNPQPIQPTPLQGFAAHVADPANIQALAPSLTPPRTIIPAKDASFWDANSNMLAPKQPQVLPAQGQPAQPQAQPASWFQPSQQTQQDQQRLRDLQNSGAGLNQIQNPVLRGFAKAGDIAASILVPHAAPFIPGTTAHNLQLQAQQQGRVNSDVAQDQSRAQAVLQGLQAQDTQAQTVQRNAQTANIPILQRAKMMQAQQMGAAHGLKPAFDDNGNQTGWEPDEDSPVYQKQKAAVDVMESQNELKQAQAALATLQQQKFDPNSPIFKQTQQRLATAQQNAGAAQLRAQAYYGNYLQGAYNTGLNGQVLPGAPVISNDQGQQTVVGSKNASQAAKSQGNAAQFNDVYTALDGLEGSANALKQAGGKLNNPILLQAYKEPVSTLGQWAQNALVSGKLSPQERDLVTNIVAAREKIQGLRKSAGGSTSDSQVDRLEQLLPGPNTPDFDYFGRQMKQVRTMADKLGAGATTAAGGLTINGRGGALNSTPQGGGKTLDRATAQQFLQQAGGDKAKARQLATKAGYAY